MKIILQGFSGVLENGNKYRVLSKTEKDGELSLLSLDVLVQLMPVFDKDYWVKDYELSVNKWYSEKNGEYKETLKFCLLKLENNLGVQLLKSEMKINI
jgi:hypothetical protein